MSGLRLQVLKPSQVIVTAPPNPSGLPSSHPDLQGYPFKEPPADCAGEQEPNKRPSVEILPSE